MRRLNLPTGAALADVQRRLMTHAAGAAKRIPALLHKISATATAADPLTLYAQLHVLAAMHRASLPGPVAFGIDALVEFYGGLVTAMPTDDVVDRLGVEVHPSTLFELERLLRAYGNAENLAHQARVVREGGLDSLTRARHLLEFERRFDRMMGYPAQLRPIFSAIVDPLDEKTIKVLGYALSDALSAADAYSEVVAERTAEIVERFNSASELATIPQDHQARVQALAMRMGGMASSCAAQIEDDLPALLAERARIPQERLTAVLEALATPLGSQPEFSALMDTNRLRRYPIVRLPDGRYLWPRPVDFIQEALDWAGEVCQADPNLRKFFDKRRQDACEELTHQALSDVFGTSDVHKGYTYPAEGRPDIDVLVATPGATIVAEVKGGRFTEPARRAAPDRIRKKTGEFVDKALSQNARTIAHLESGAAGLQDPKRRPVTIPNAPNAVSIIVTLDRVDPFATHLPDGGKRSGAPAAGTWLVTLADLLMVTDILRHPAEFYAYAHTRAAINQAGGPLIFVETDAVGAWCEGRIEPVHVERGQINLLGTTSEIMNDYYTHMPDDGDQPVRPSTGVPREVLAALDEVLRDRPEHWRNLSVSVLAARPENWQSLRKALRQQAVGGAAIATTRRARKRARRACGGIKVGRNLTVFLATDLLPQQVLNETILVVRPNIDTPAV
ncbi:hypothetical protein [Couchioplanes azureus]|nr:hypothetical protein [Couchioplanes caeruleus]